MIQNPPIQLQNVKIIFVLNCSGNLNLKTGCANKLSTVTAVRLYFRPTINRNCWLPKNWFPGVCLLSIRFVGAVQYNIRDVSFKKVPAGWSWVGRIGQFFNTLYYFVNIDFGISLGNLYIQIRIASKYNFSAPSGRRFLPLCPCPARVGTLEIAQNDCKPV